jgi:integrase/recombinase XerD
MSEQLPAEIVPASRVLTAAEFHRLADVPPEVEWFANLTNPNTRRGYENAVRDFMQFTGIARPEEFRNVTRAHIIAWRDELRQRENALGQRKIGDSTIRHRLASLAALFEYLCDKNAVTHNPVKGERQSLSEAAEPVDLSSGKWDSRCAAAAGGSTLSRFREVFDRRMPQSRPGHRRRAMQP